jgi:hypothetical protein
VLLNAGSTDGGYVGSGGTGGCCALIAWSRERRRNVKRSGRRCIVAIGDENIEPLIAVELGIVRG